MAYTAEQKKEISKIVEENLKEYAYTQELTYAENMIFDAPADETLAKTLGKVSTYLLSVSMPATTGMILPIFKNQLAIMDGQIKKYLNV